MTSRHSLPDGEVTFSSMVRMRCNDCGEHSDNGYNQSPDDWVRKHRLRHSLGRCGCCHHWRDEHRLTDKRMDEYLRTGQQRCCVHPMGMGDNCWCPGG